MSVLAPPLGTQTPPPAPRGLPVLHWTVDAFHRAAAAGVFGDRRPVLVRGVLLEQGPMNHPHAVALELLTDALRATFGANWRVRVQLPLVLGADTDPMPDAAVLAGSPRAATAHPTTADLVVEVSDTTLHDDLTTKAELYATANIAEYWVIDLDGRELHVFRDPQTNAALNVTTYRLHTKQAANEAVSPLAAPNASISVADLLP